MKVSLILTGFEEVRGYRAGMLDDLYRMVQELMNNVVKHAGASQVLLELTEHEDVVSLMVEDDGVGVGEDVSGRGLDEMRAKVAYYHGRMEISRRREGGTLVVIEFKK
jgi:signal transduction histidine kinase